MRGHAIANGTYVVRGEPRRARSRSSARGWSSGAGRSSSDPFGRILKKASTDKEEILVVKCDRKLMEDVRRNWPFFRDRRIDAYQRHHETRGGLNRRSERRRKPGCPVHSCTAGLRPAAQMEAPHALPILFALTLFAVSVYGVRRRLEAGTSPAHDEVGQEGHARERLAGIPAAATRPQGLAEPQRPVGLRDHAEGSREAREVGRQDPRAVLRRDRALAASASIRRRIRTCGIAAPSRSRPGGRANACCSTSARWTGNRRCS